MTDKLDRLLAGQAVIFSMLNAVLKIDTRLLSLLAERNGATRLAFELPSVTRKGKIMANYELADDEVSTITIKATNSAGSVEPIPGGDTFTAVSSNPTSLGAAIGKDASGNPALVLTPLVQASPGIVVTVSDSAGLAKAAMIVDVVPDVTPANLILDTADAVLTPQAPPAAPGP